MNSSRATARRVPWRSAARIGAAAGVQYPHIAALSEVAVTVSVEDDFDGGLRMLIAGIAAAGS